MQQVDTSAKEQIRQKNSTFKVFKQSLANKIDGDLDNSFCPRSVVRFTPTDESLIRWLNETKKNQFQELEQTENEKQLKKISKQVLK